MQLSLLLSAAIVVATTASIPIRLGVVLGADNSTTPRHHFSRALTSDQEQWCALRAGEDAAARLASSPGLYALEMTLLYAGSDADSNASAAKVSSFIAASAARGAGIVIGGYMSDRTLLLVKDTAATLGVMLLAPASGLPVIPPPRESVLRLWPADNYQANVLSKLALKRASAAVVLTANDAASMTLAKLFAQQFTAGGGTLAAPIASYNPPADPSSSGAYYAKVLKPLADAVAASSSFGGVAFVMNVGNADIAGLLDAMRADYSWPIEKTSGVFLTDRATPTRSVVANPDRALYAATLNLTGTLSSLAIRSNPVYASLALRWRDAGFETSLFASACSLYDAIGIAVTASLALGGGNTTRPQLHSKKEVSPLRAALLSTARTWWGASGLMNIEAKSGDLYRATYDVYGVVYEPDYKSAVWEVVGVPIDGKPSTPNREAR